MKEMDPPLWEPTCAEACRLLLTLEEQQWHRRRRNNAECRKMYKSCLSLFFLYAENPQIWSQKKAWDTPKIDLKLAWKTDLHFFYQIGSKEEFLYLIGRKGKFFIRNEKPFFKCGYPPAPVQTLRHPSEHQSGQTGGGRGRNKLKKRDIEKLL